MSKNKNRILVFLGILTSRVFGYIRDLTIAKYFGATKITDVFFLAFMIPNLLRRLLAEGSLSAAFIPVFNEELVKEKNKANQLCKNLISFLFYLTLIISVFGIIFSKYIFMILGKGFVEPYSSYGSLYLKIMFPIIIFISVGSVFMGVLNSLNRFFLTSFAFNFINISMIITIIFFRKYFYDRGLLN